MRSLPICLVPLLFGAIAFAASPPDYVNYQGVLRDASNAPVDGAHDMVFRFHSAETGGDEILVDRQTGADSTAVMVTGGMFSAHLGAGALLDGSGPGTYASLGEVFRDYGTVWLSIEVAGELLDPRVRVISAPYAHNAATLDGRAAGEFLDASITTQTKAGRLELGSLSVSAPLTAIEAYGYTAGRFESTGGTGTASIAQENIGIIASGQSYGGYFLDTDHGSYGQVGWGGYGIRALGTTAGGYFKDLDLSGYAEVGTYHDGIRAYGNSSGGYFADLDSSGVARLGYGDRGVDGRGDAMGGYFEDDDGSGYAHVGIGNRGIEGFGTNSGAYFEDLDSSGEARLGYGDHGVDGRGNGAGGYFWDNDDSGHAFVGVGDRGIAGYGNSSGGYFKDSTSSGESYVGYGDRGIWGKGTFAGGTFSHPNDTTHWADVSTPTRKIVGTGTVSFVQNHPYEKDKVIVYAAPEGDEVAVYTRGSARLSDGEARVPLGETFALVANPDIGLTAHLTARSELVPLLAESVSPTELVVRGPAGSEAEFDYLVYGLRIGFEELPPVQLKERDAFLPSREAVEGAYADRPDLRRFNALERFMAMAPGRGGSSPPDLSRSRALVAAINENRDAILAAATEEAAAERERPEHRFGGLQPIDEHAPTASDASPASTSLAVPAGANRPPVEVAAGETPAALSGATWLGVAEPVEAGDVLALDPDRPGLLHRAASMADPNVVGPAIGSSREHASGGLEVPLGDTRFVEIKADAGYAAIRAGDLLVASPTPGHAMRAHEIVPGTILGKALEPLETGTGRIRVIWMLR